MTLIVYDVRMLEHATPAGHPEKPERIRRAWARLEKSGLADRCKRLQPELLDDVALTKVHESSMIRAAEALGQQGGGYLDADTPIVSESIRAAKLAAGGACAAVDAVLENADQNAFVLARPPGHHATPNRSMGFCVFNTIAVAARHALDKHQLDRVLIVDFDVHHGNGTQDIFYRDPQVTFFSSHRYPFYPGTGSQDETGAGAGLGTTFNLPVTQGTAPETFRQRFQAMLEHAAQKSNPQLVLLSAGFDAHRQDPVGDLGLDMEDFDFLTHLVLEVAHHYCHGRLVSVLEGGYNIPVLAGCIEEHVKVLVESSTKNAS
jgi:acetoin utilization deacetylase AcuC-like enzyme